MKNKVFCLGFATGFFALLALSSIFVFFLWVKPRRTIPISAQMPTFGVFAPDGVRIIYVRDGLSQEPNNVPFEGLVALDEDFTKIAVFRFPPELSQARQVSIVGDSRLRFIGFISPSVERGILWNPDKRQFEVVDAGSLRKTSSESNGIVLYRSYRASAFR